MEAGLKVQRQFPRETIKTKVTQERQYCLPCAHHMTEPAVNSLMESHVHFLHQLQCGPATVRQICIGTKVG